MTTLTTENFTFGRDEVEAFTCGDCNHLAWALHETFGYELVGFSWDDNIENWCHFGNLLPDGRFFDITGIRTVPEAEATWGGPAHRGDVVRELAQATIMAEGQVYSDYSAFEYAHAVHEILEDSGIAVPVAA